MPENRAGGNTGQRIFLVFLLFALSLAAFCIFRPPVSFRYRSWLLVPIAFSLANLLTPLVRLVALRCKVVDHPEARKVHTEATPLLGGVAVYMAFALSAVSVFWYSPELKGVLLAASIVFVIGVLDDIFGLSSLVRLLAQLVAVLVLFGFGMQIDSIPDPTRFHLLKKAITIIWVLGITNSVNFLDGLDGLCAGFGAIAALFTGLIAFLTHQYFLMFLGFSLAGSCLGFLPWNFPRRGSAAIFMGDAGSLFIGFTLAALSIMGDWAENRVVALTVPVLILFLPIFDTSMTTFFRIREGKVRTIREWLDFVGRDHIHHRVYSVGIGKRHTVLILWVVAVMLGFSAVIIRTGGMLEAYLSLIQASLVLVCFTGFIVHMKNRQDAMIRIAQRMTANEPDGGDVFGVSM